MPDYTGNDAPWNAEKANIKTIDLTGASKLANIGNYAFADCANLTKVTLPDSIKTIGDAAFYKCILLPTIDISRITY
ncbi:MAG: leucine-rich repeat protein, partial [Anaerovoracaceae bacterium]